MSDSNKKSLLKKQSKIDGFFKNPPKTPSKDKSYVRVNQADTDMKKAIEMSLKATDGRKDPTIEKEGVEEETKRKQGEELPGGEVEPTFAYVGPSVRRKEDRKKLRGFDCG